MRTSTLEDAAEYQKSLIARMDRNPAATENDKYMTRHILEIITDRIRDKETGNDTNTNKI